MQRNDNDGAAEEERPQYSIHGEILPNKLTYRVNH